VGAKVFRNSAQSDGVFRHDFTFSLWSMGLVQSESPIRSWGVLAVVRFIRSITAIDFQKATRKPADLDVFDVPFLKTSRVDPPLGNSQHPASHS
jgi:hypothetical protein